MIDPGFPSPSNKNNFVNTRSTKPRRPSGLLNKKLLTDVHHGLFVEIYALDASSEFATVVGRITNLLPDQTTTFQMCITDKTSPSEIDVVEPLITLEPNDVYIISGEIMGRGERILVKLLTGRASTRVTGFEDLYPN